MNPYFVAGIEQAAEDLKRENDEAIWQEGVLRHVPIVGSLYNWISPLQKPQIKGKPDHSWILLILSSTKRTLNSINFNRFDIFRSYPEPERRQVAEHRSHLQQAEFRQTRRRCWSGWKHRSSVKRCSPYTNNSTSDRKVIFKSSPSNSRLSAGIVQLGGQKVPSCRLLSSHLM